jgi:saccharopine dehydrogenase-like NADP-dependent oxidoreductase
VNIPTHDLFKNPFQVDFPQVGMLDVYPNRDSMAYRTIYGIPEAQTVYRGTFRYNGWCETLDVMKHLNLISGDSFDMKGMTYSDMIAHQIGKQNPTGIRQQVATFLNIPVTSYALDALEWLGMFKAEPMGRGIDSTFEVTSDKMISRMGLGPQERDMVVLQHNFLAGYSDGRKEIIRSRMLDFGTLATDTSIARTVALPAAIGAEMILLGKITVKGVHIPIIPEIYNPVLDQLESMNIRMTEEYGLPLSENIA